MLRLFFLLNGILFSILPLSLPAQKALSGLWEGIITEGGLHTKDGHRFELFLQVQDGHIKGQSYIYVSKDSIITKRLSGKMYEDRSVYLEEAPTRLGSWEEDEGSAGEFSRKYQFVFKRSIWDSSLEGYWQDISTNSSSHKRQRGRIILKKKAHDAKA
jgi:hypothetical protein